MGRWQHKVKVTPTKTQQLLIGGLLGRGDIFRSSSKVFTASKVSGQDVYTALPMKMTWQRDYLCEGVKGVAAQGGALIHGVLYDDGQQLQPQMLAFKDVRRDILFSLVCFLSPQCTMRASTLIRASTEHLRTEH